MARSMDAATHSNRTARSSNSSGPSSPSISCRRPSLLCRCVPWRASVPIWPNTEPPNTPRSDRPVQTSTIRSTEVSDGSAATKAPLRAPTLEPTIRSGRCRARIGHAACPLRPRRERLHRRGRMRSYLGLPSHEVMPGAFGGAAPSWFRAVRTRVHMATWVSHA